MRGGITCSKVDLFTRKSCAGYDTNLSGERQQYQRRSCNRSRIDKDPIMKYDSALYLFVAKTAAPHLRSLDQNPTLPLTLLRACVTRFDLIRRLTAPPLAHCEQSTGLFAPEGKVP